MKLAIFWRWRRNGQHNVLGSLVQVFSGVTWWKDPCLYEYIIIYTYIHTYIHSRIHTYIYTYIHIYIYTYTYTHTYIHTYITLHYIHREIEFPLGFPTNFKLGYLENYQRCVTVFTRCQRPRARAFPRTSRLWVLWLRWSFQAEALPWKMMQTWCLWCFLSWLSIFIFIEFSGFPRISGNAAIHTIYSIYIYIYI